MSKRFTQQNCMEKVNLLAPQKNKTITYPSETKIFNPKD